MRSTRLSFFLVFLMINVLLLSALSTCAAAEEDETTDETVDPLDPLEPIEDPSDENLELSPSSIPKKRIPVRKIIHTPIRIPKLPRTTTVRQSDPTLTIRRVTTSNRIVKLSACDCPCGEDGLIGFHRGLALPSRSSRFRLSASQQWNRLTRVRRQYCDASAVLRVIVLARRPVSGFMVYRVKILAIFKGLPNIVVGQQVQIRSPLGPCGVNIRPSKRSLLFMLSTCNCNTQHPTLTRCDFVLPFNVLSRNERIFLSNPNCRGIGCGLFSVSPFSVTGDEVAKDPEETTSSEVTEGSDSTDPVEPDPTPIPIDQEYVS